MSEDNVTNEVVYLHTTISSCFSNNDIDADSIVAIKRDWLEKYLCETNVADNPITLKEFLDEYNSEDTNEIMASAILEDTIAFTLCTEDDDTPVHFFGDEDWKIRAFLDYISQLLQDNGFERASKFLDCQFRL